MYARTTTITGDPRAVDNGIADVRDEVWPMVQQLEGYVGLSMLADREAGRCIITTAWADEAAMRASADVVRDSRARAAEMMRADRVDIQEWEIIRMHRDHPTREGACARVTWMAGDMAQLERSIDAMGMSVLPRLEELPGFCSVSQLLDRNTGMSTVTAVYDSREAMDRSAEQVSGMRSEVMADSGVRIPEVAAFDLAIAHLRVPEMA
jgi:heme-degrading monooxygenase HmoA